MSNGKHEGIAERLARDIDSDRQVDGVMLLRHELERNPQQALQLIQQEIDREQRNGSTKRLEVHANGELFITNFQPASGYASEGSYVGMYPGQRNQPAEQPAERPQPRQERPYDPGPPTPLTPGSDYSRPRASDDAAPPKVVSEAPYPLYDQGRPPQGYYGQATPSYREAPPPYYPPAQTENGIGTAAAVTLGVLGAAALGFYAGRNNGGWGNHRLSYVGGRNHYPRNHYQAVPYPMAYGSYQQPGSYQTYDDDY